MKTVWFNGCHVSGIPKQRMIVIEKGIRHPKFGNLYTIESLDGKITIHNVSSNDIQEGN